MKKNILVVDDDPLVVRSVGKYLKSCGYHVLTARSGDAALEVIAGAKIDLIISDIRMPGMNGLETLRRIKECNNQNPGEHIPAILITAYAGDDELHRKASALGVVECIYKPFNIGELNVAVRRCLELPPQYQRTHPRIDMDLPLDVRINGISGNIREPILAQAVNISEDGVGIRVQNIVPRFAVVDIALSSSPQYTLIEAQALISWCRPSLKENTYRAGLHFLKIEDAYLSILMEILAEYKVLDKGFLSLIKEIKCFLEGLKERLGVFDRGNNSQSEYGNFIKDNKQDIFKSLDEYFFKIWGIIKDMDKDTYAVHQRYYQHLLGGLLLEPIETNRHVYQKPLGYSGDYLMMNYIYDYHKDAYLGSSTYEKLLNHYTCNIPISCSNIERKDFLKKKISETLGKKEKTRILSFACGPARELLELVSEGRITYPVSFYCLDPEKKALAYIAGEVQQAEFAKRQLLSVEYVCRDIAAIIRDKGLRDSLKHQDLIYAFGVFDYLSDKIAVRLVNEFYGLLQDGGRILIFNANAKNSSYRAYYELLGGWHLVHRSEEQMLSWTKDLTHASQIKFEELSKQNNYLCLSIEK